MTQNGANVIHTERADIPCDAYAATYTAALEQCLQGLISPATLGVDLKKRDNAEAQREKEKVTLYTRARIVEALQECLKRLAESALRAAREGLPGTEAKELPEAEVAFGDYGSPDFDSQVATVALAVEKGVMSVECAMDELYGDTRSEAWKAEEARRLRAENGERR